jgi:hypothetical protein
LKKIKMLEELTIKESSGIFGGAGASSDCNCYCSCHCSCACDNADVLDATKDAEKEWTFMSTYDQVLGSNSA